MKSVRRPGEQQGQQEVAHHQCAGEVARGRTHVVEVDLQGLVTGAHQHVGKHELAEQEGERQKQRRQQPLAQAGNHHQQEGAAAARPQQVGGIHQIPERYPLQAVGQRPVHEGEHHGEPGADQDPWRADNGQNAVGVDLQQPDRGDHRRHREGEQDQQVHPGIQLWEVVGHHQHGRHQHQGSQQQGGEADQQASAKRRQKARVAPELEIPVEGEAVWQQGRPPAGGDGVEKGGQQRQQQGSHQGPQHPARPARFQIMHGIAPCSRSSFSAATG